MQTSSKVYNLFLLNERKELARYKNIFLHSLEKIEMAEKQLQLRTNANSSNKKLPPSPAVLVEAIVRESDCLLNSLKVSYKEAEEDGETTYLHSLLTS